MTKNSKTTSLDIAYLAGVSQSTVSRALSGSPLVNEETREKVEAIATQLNYQVDRSASRLRAQNTKTIALLLCEDPGWGDSQINPFFLSILSSIAHAVATRGYDLLLSFQQLSDDWGSDFESAHRADGIILLGYGDHVSYCEKLEQLNDNDAHFVQWGPQVAGQPPCCSIGCNNISSAYQMTRHLTGLGLQRIAFLGDISTQNPEFAERYEGHVKALLDARLIIDPALQIPTDTSSEEAGHKALMQLVNSGAEFDAIFGASDLVALGAMQALGELGRTIPDDVAVVGFDDIPIAAYTHPPLTTMRQNTLLAGEMLVDNLLKIIHGEPADSACIPTELIVRKSCGAS